MPGPPSLLSTSLLTYEISPFESFMCFILCSLPKISSNLSCTGCHLAFRSQLNYGFFTKKVFRVVDHIVGMIILSSTYLCHRLCPRWWLWVLPINDWQCFPAFDILGIQGRMGLCLVRSQWEDQPIICRETRYKYGERFVLRILLRWLGPVNLQSRPAGWTLWQNFYVTGKFPSPEKTICFYS